MFHCAYGTERACAH